jgi:hypothetical protein
VDSHERSVAPPLATRLPPRRNAQAKRAEADAGRLRRIAEENEKRLSQRIQQGTNSPGDDSLVPATSAAAGRRTPARAAARPRAPEPSADVVVSTVTLSAAAKKAAAGFDSVALRVDFPGAPLAYSAPVRVADIVAGRALLLLNLKASIALGTRSKAGLRARRELLQALEAGNSPDANVLYELVGLTKPEAAAVAALVARAATAGADADAAPALPPPPEGKLLGSSAVSLEAMLEADADRVALSLNLVAPAAAAGAAPLGSISTDVRCIVALRALDDALETLGSAKAAVAADAEAARRDSDELLPVGAAARAGGGTPANSAAARAAARAAREATPYHQLPPRARAAFASLRAQVRAGAAASVVDYAAVLSGGAFAPSQLAARAAEPAHTLAGALGAAAPVAAPVGATAAAAASQLLLRAVKAEGIPSPPPGLLELGRAVRVCIFDASTATIVGNIFELAAEPAAQPAAAAASAAASAAAAAGGWAFDKAVQLLARASGALLAPSADRAADALLLLFQLEMTVVPRPDGGAGAKPTDAAQAARARRRAGADGADGAYWQRRKARARTLAVCWGSLPLAALAEWRPAPARAEGKKAAAAVKERSIQLRRGSVFASGGPLAATGVGGVARAARRARAPAGAPAAADAPARPFIAGAALTIALAPPASAELALAATLPPAATLVCEVSQLKQLGAHAAVVAQARAAAAATPGGARAPHWAPEAAALAQLSRAPDLAAALGRVWAERLKAQDAKTRKAQGAELEHALLGEAALALTLLLSAAGLAFGRESVASAAQVKARAAAIAKAEREAVDRQSTLIALAAPGTSAAFRYSALLLEDPAAIGERV